MFGGLDLHHQPAITVAAHCLRSIDLTDDGRRCLDQRRVELHDIADQAQRRPKSNQDGDDAVHQQLPTGLQVGGGLAVPVTGAKPPIPIP